MKEKTQVFLLKALAALGLTLGLGPAALLLGRFFLPGEAAKWYVLWLLPFVWGVGSYACSGRMRLIVDLLGLIPLGALGALWLWPHGFPALTVLIPGAILLVLLPPAYPRMTWEEWPTVLWLAGFGVQLAGQALAGKAELSGLETPLAICFGLYAFLFLLTHNRQSLRLGMHGGQKAPPAMARRNRLLISGMFLIALLISCWGPVGTALNAAWTWIKHALGTAIMWFMNLFAQDSGGASSGSAGGDASDMLAGLGTAEASPFAKLMEKVFLVAAYVLLAAAAVFACWFLFKKLRQLIRFLAGKLQQYADAAAVDYVDEQESTLNLDEKTKALRDRLQKAFARSPRKQPWSALDGRARVRRLYQEFAKKRRLSPALTAREALTQDPVLPHTAAAAFADLYDQARYSEHPVTAAQADALRDNLS